MLDIRICDTCKWFDLTTFCTYCTDQECWSSAKVDWEKRADRLSRLEYMLRCKKDILWEVQPDPEDTKYHAVMNELDDAICRVSGLLANAIANGG